MPKRIHLSRFRRLPAGARKVDRSTRWGNPFNATQIYIAFGAWGFPIPLMPLNEPPSLGRCLDLFTAYLLAKLEHDPRFLEPLRGKDLACWCPPDRQCHADILLRLANREGFA